MPVSDPEPAIRADATAPGRPAARSDDAAPAASDDGSALGPEHLANRIEALALEARIVRPGVPTPSVQAAAQALGVTEERIVKSLVFVVEGDTGAPDSDPAQSAGPSAETPDLVLAIAAGTGRVDTARLAGALGVDPARVRLARPAQVTAWTGYGVGAMPPFGHLRPLRTLIDAVSVPAEGVVYGGGGSRHAMLEIGVDALEAATGARRVELTPPT